MKKIILAIGLLLVAANSFGTETQLTENEYRGYDWAFKHNTVKPSYCLNRPSVEERTGCLIFIKETVPSQEDRIISHGGGMSSSRH